VADVAAATAKKIARRADGELTRASTRLDLLGAWLRDGSCATHDRRAMILAMNSRGALAIALVSLTSCASEAVGVEAGVDATLDREVVYCDPCQDFTTRPDSDFCTIQRCGPSEGCYRRGGNPVWQCCEPGDCGR
jgi:hypothetical protein